MARVEKTIEVNVPVRTAYNQWTQFEEFPRFMEGVEQVTQLDDKRLRWKAKIGGTEKAWDAVIREQVPDEKVIWRNTSGAENAGMVKFDKLGPELTRVHLEMSYDPEGFTENVGDMLGMFGRRVQGDLDRFKEFIESRGQETGAWRGEISNPDVPGGHTSGSPDAGEPGRSKGDERRSSDAASNAGRASLGANSGVGAGTHTGSGSGVSAGGMQGTGTGAGYQERGGSPSVHSSGMTEPTGGNPSYGGGTSSQPERRQQE
jgi:hypothetical protein